MDSAKSQLIDRLKTASSVLVTVSRDPSVDQLAACIGLTLLVNKLDKHGSAVFSGKIPSTIEFLKPEDTIEKNADSLRDFIIALDKGKADKLRYKVEDQLVKIFITPYKTSLSEKDLEFSQGDFNVELIIALGVRRQEDLDQAIVAHGRILHDATVACITTSDQSDLGNISWRDPAASSLCELVTDLASGMGDNLIDEQIATALLTGIIAETDRFSNEKTSAQTMSVSAKLMSAGANQQLVATNLNEPPPPVNLKNTDQPKVDEKTQPSADDGTLSIKHDDLDLNTLPPPAEDNPSAPANEPENSNDQDSSVTGGPKLVTQPPALGGMLTANSVPEEYDPSTDPLSNGLPTDTQPALGHTQTTLQPDIGQPMPPQPIQPPADPAPVYTPPPPTWTPPPAPLPPPTPIEPAVSPPPSDETPFVAKEPQTLDEIEAAVDSPHLHNEGVNNAREQVDAVLAESPGVVPEPRSDLNAAPLGEPLHEDTTNISQADAQQNAKILKSTGLDPSLFSELPTDDSQAPPVPPPIQYPIVPDNKDTASENK